MAVQENVLSARVNIRYVAETRRDLRIDMLRGIALVMMVVAHTEVLSILNVITWERFGLTTGAEGFVILSGFMIGFLKRRQLQTEPMLTVAYSLLRRAVTLYIVNVVIIVSILILSQLRFIDTFEVTHFTDRFSGTSYSLFPVNDQVREAWFNEVIFLQIGPHQSQILGLYFYLLLVSPVILWLLKSKRSGVLILLSTAAYVFYQFSHVRGTSAQFEFAFPLLAWQLIYVLGMCCGWYKEEIFSLAKTQIGKGVLAGMVIFALIMMFVDQNHTNPFLPSEIMMHFIVPEDFNWFYQTFAAKNELGPLRIANDFCLIITMYLLLTRYWMPINRLLGWFLIVLGQNSLYVFIVHVYVILLVTQFFTFNLWEQRWFFNTLIHLSVLMILWLMARYGFMRKIIPN